MRYRCEGVSQHENSTMTPGNERGVVVKCAVMVGLWAWHFDSPFPLPEFEQERSSFRSVGLESVCSVEEIYPDRHPALMGRCARENSDISGAKVLECVCVNSDPER